MIAISAPLESVLDRLVRLVESQMTRDLRLRPAARRRRASTCGTAPRRACRRPIPRPSTASRIGPDVGSCGTAAYRRETVIVADIMSRSAVGRLSGPGRRAWPSLVLVDPDPVASRRGARHIRDVFASRCANRPPPRRASSMSPTRIAGIAIERKQAEDRIHFMANHDALTGLPNRTLLKDRLTQARALRQAIRPLGDGRVHRSRQFQNRQRQPRPQCRRRTFEDCRRAHGRLRQGDRHGGAARRRRIRDPAVRPAQERGYDLRDAAENPGGDRRADPRRRP